MGNETEREKAAAQPLRRKISDSAVRASQGRYAVDLERQRMWFRASTNQLCPDLKVIEPGAWKRGMKQYMKNPIVLESHHYDSVTERTLGRAVDWELDDTGLLLQVEFAPTGPGQAGWVLYSGGYANAGSVGWETLKSERATDEASGTEYERITQAQLLEFSLCAVGADNAALAKHENPFVELAVRTLAAPVSETRPGWDEPDGGHMIHYRVREPEEFTGKLVTLSLDVKATADVQVVRGHLKDGDEELHAQSVRFDKDDGWTLGEAKSWWASHKDELGREAEAEGNLSMAGLVEAHKAIREELDKVLALCTDIRTSLAAKSLVVEVQDLDKERQITIAREPEPNPLAARLKEVADAVTLAPNEVMERLRRFRQEND